jgi:hypothetical protein
MERRLERARVRRAEASLADPARGVTLEVPGKPEAAKAEEEPPRRHLVRRMLERRQQDEDLHIHAERKPTVTADVQ